MPIYEYKCTKCSKEFEMFQRITDDTIPSCEFCQGKAKKLISRSTFHLKGSGWYVTDYGGKKPSSRETDREEASSNAGTGETTAKAETKTETTTETKTKTEIKAEKSEA